MEGVALSDCWVYCFCCDQKATLPRGDVSDEHRVMWTGSKKSYAGTHAAILNMRRLRMSYSKTLQVLTLLKQTHRGYADVHICSEEDCEWEGMKSSITVSVCGTCMRMACSLGMCNVCCRKTPLSWRTRVRPLMRHT